MLSSREPKARTFDLRRSSGPGGKTPGSRHVQITGQRAVAGGCSRCYEKWTILGRGPVQSARVGPVRGSGLRPEGRPGFFRAAKGRGVPRGVAGGGFFPGGRLVRCIRGPCSRIFAAESRALRPRKRPKMQTPGRIRTPRDDHPSRPAGGDTVPFGTRSQGLDGPSRPTSSAPALAEAFAQRGTLGRHDWRSGLVGVYVRFDVVRSRTVDFCPWASTGVWQPGQENGDRPGDGLCLFLFVTIGLGEIGKGGPRKRGSPTEGAALAPGWGVIRGVIFHQA